MVSRNPGSPETTPATAPVAALVYLSGTLRGRTRKLAGETLELDASRGAAHPAGTDLRDRVATLHRAGSSYELDAGQSGLIRVNGHKPSGASMLAAGDLIEIEGGPVIRFRLYTDRATMYKSPAEVFADCLDCASQDTRNPLLKLPAMFSDLARGLATQTSLWFRIAVVIAIVSLAGLLTVQTMQSRHLETRLAIEQDHVIGLGELLRRVESQSLSRAELADVRSELRDELQRGLSQTSDRVLALEARSAAATRAIAAATPSIAFVQGSFGFEDPATRRVLRLTLGADGAAQRLPDGRPLVSLGGDGPPVEISFSGTAFVVHPDGLMLTNRHVALPWEGEEALPGIRQLGLSPVIRRMQAYLPGRSDAFAVSTLGASKSQDLAILDGGEAAREARALALGRQRPAPGDEAIVMGFPTGIRALLARAGDRFVAELGDRPGMDVWSAARELARAGLMSPLASRGIVAQVTNEAIVYDAATTSGGSGGPVLNLAGEVVAVNRAILPGFGGSNLGVPIEHARELMRTLKVRPIE